MRKGTEFLKTVQERLISLLKSSFSISICFEYLTYVSVLAYVPEIAMSGIEKLARCRKCCDRRLLDDQSRISGIHDSTLDISNRERVIASRMVVSAKWEHVGLSDDTAFCSFCDSVSC
jgi:hypothetical protein